MAERPDEPRGRIIASCGHEIRNADDLVPVIYKSEDCDAVQGFRPVTVYAEFCRACADELRGTDDWLESREEAERWLAEERRKGQPKRQSESFCGKKQDNESPTFSAEAASHAGSRTGPLGFARAVYAAAQSIVATSGEEEVRNTARRVMEAAMEEMVRVRREAGNG